MEWATAMAARLAPMRLVLGPQILVRPAALAASNQARSERKLRQGTRGCSEVARDGIFDWRARGRWTAWPAPTPELPRVFQLSLNPPSFSPQRESRALFVCIEDCAYRDTPGARNTSL